MLKKSSLQFYFLYYSINEEGGDTMQLTLTNSDYKTESLINRIQKYKEYTKENLVKKVQEFKEYTTKNLVNKVSKMASNSQSYRLDSLKVVKKEKSRERDGVNRDISIDR